MLCIKNHVDKLKIVHSWREKRLGYWVTTFLDWSDTVRGKKRKLLQYFPLKLLKNGITSNSILTLHSDLHGCSDLLSKMHTTTSYIQSKSIRILSTDVLSGSNFITSLFVHQANMYKSNPTKLIICEGMNEISEEKRSPSRILSPVLQKASSIHIFTLAPISCSYGFICRFTTHNWTSCLDCSLPIWRFRF